MAMNEKQFQLLLAIRDGKKYSKANGPLSALARAAVIKVKTNAKFSITSAELTEWGQVVLTVEEKVRGIRCFACGALKPTKALKGQSGLYCDNGICGLGKSP